MSKIPSFFKSINGDFTLINGDCNRILTSFDFKFDMIFADPPYFLSNGGISVSNGKKVCVDKGIWDKGGTPEYVDRFNHLWLSECCKKLKDNGTIWVSGTYHNIFSVGNVLSELGFKILNVVTWVKSDPPNNISHRVLTHSTEFIIWAKKSKRAYHIYNYNLMCRLNLNREMTDVWCMPAVQKWEKSCGKHPTQKPLALLARIIFASTQKDNWILDPFAGSGTTGIAANLLGRKFLGIDQDLDYLRLAVNRRKELDNSEIKIVYQEKLFQDCYTTNIKGDHKINVLIGRMGSVEQTSWLFSHHMYNLPVSKVLSMPKLLSVEYVLILFQGCVQPKFYRVAKMKPQIRTKEQINQMSGSLYLPKRDSSYWVLNLIEDNEYKFTSKHFNRRKLISSQQERGAYWIRTLQEVINSYE